MINSARRINTDSPMFRVALLSPSLLLSDTGAVSPTLPYLAKQFPEVSQTAIQSFITMPALAGILATLAAAAIASAIGKRRLVLIGILCIVVGGVSPLLLIPAGNFVLLMSVRALVGIGVGLLQPLSASLIADFFRGKKRHTMLGLQSSVVGLGNVIWGLVVSVLMLFGWQAAFFVYLAALGVFALIWVFVPDPKNVSTLVASEDEAASGKSNDHVAVTSGAARFGLPWGTISASLLMLFMTMGFMALGISVPFLAIDQRGFTDGSGVSLIMTTFGVSSIVTGLAFGLVFGKLRSWTATVSLMVLASGLALAAVAGSLAILFVAAALVGLGFGTYMPFAITTMNARANAAQSVLVTAILFTGASVGGFLAPYFFGAIDKLTGNTDASGQFLTAAALIIVVTVVGTVFYQADARGAAAGIRTSSLELEGVV